MASITRTEVKKYLQITDTTYDDRIDYLIPIVESDLFDGILHRNFVDYNGDDQTPEGIKKTLAQMVNHHVSVNVTPVDQTKGLIQSIGDLRYFYYTGEDSYSGYPKYIINNSVLRYRIMSRGYRVGESEMADGYNFLTNIELTGDINGVNKEFTTTYTIKSDTELVFVGQIKATRDVDYTISGSTITFTNAPLTGETLTFAAKVK